MGKYKDIHGQEHDEKETIPAGAFTIHGKTYMCAYCYALIKPGSDHLPTCPKCGWDRWLK